MVKRPKPPPPRRARLIQKLASLIVLGTYRRVTVLAPDAPQDERPQLSVSNHFGGFADPLLLVHAMPRMPRIIARDQIWKVPVVGWLMNWFGAIPVHKPEDGPATPSRNDQMFASAYGALEDGGHLMIFPEGITRDDPSIAPIKTGAARIALGARAQGADGIQIIPAGIHYEDKAALRSRVSILVGEPLDLDTEIDQLVESASDPGPDNRKAVRGLTDDIEERLRRVAPDFADWEEAQLMTTGAEILLRSLADNPRDQVSTAQRDALAGHLARRPEEARARVESTVGVYRGRLKALGLDDAQVSSGMTGGRFLRDLLGWLVLSILLLPFALVGASINVIPYLIVKAVGLVRAAPAMLATLKPAAAILAFGITWGIVVWRVFVSFGIEGAALALLLLPVYLATVIVVSERLVEVGRAFRAWRALSTKGNAIGVLRDERQNALLAVAEAL